MLAGRSYPKDKIGLLKNLIERSGVREYCSRCLRCERWGGNVILMIIDASFTSLGLSYFDVVVPKVIEFREKMVRTSKIKSFEDLINAPMEDLKKIWKNSRSWNVAKEIAKYLNKLSKERNLSEKEAFVYWAKNSTLDGWKDDGIGKIRGVGINTYQYLRMMGGIDTVMPDKIVRKVLKEILGEIPSDDVEFIRYIEQIARENGLRAIDICWATWFVNSNVLEKYGKYLPEI